MVGRIEVQRSNLYSALDKGDWKEALSLSEKLDKLIVRFLKEANSRKEKCKNFKQKV